MMSVMHYLDADRLAAAEQFLWQSARLLERLRFEHLFLRQLRRERIVAVLAAYQNSDGGFGQSLEPDFRGPVSQPLCLELALRMLDELGTLEPALLKGALSFLERVSSADGGVPNVLSDATHYPRAPWWQPDPAQRGSLLPTASIAGLLYKHRIDHPWLQRATEFTWNALSEIEARLAASSARLALLQILYETRAALVFLEHVPDRPRAEQRAEELARALDARRVFTLPGEGESEMALPLDFATHPRALARRWFDDDTIEQHLDALIEAQEPDGGWLVSWESVTPLAGLEWRGMQTIEVLKTLRAYGRLPEVDSKLRR